jgi:hypothetical protein
MLADGGLSGGFWPIDLCDPTTGNSAHTESKVQGKGARGNDIHG